MLDLKEISRGPFGRGWNPLSLALLAGIWIATLGNWPLWLVPARLPEMASSPRAGVITPFGR